MELNPFVSQQTDSVTVHAWEPNVLHFGPLAMEVGQTRRRSLSGMALSLLCMTYLAFSKHREQRMSPLVRSLVRHGGILVRAEYPGSTTDAQVVRMASMDDLAAMARVLAKPVCWEETPPSSLFFLIDDAKVIYLFSIPPNVIQLQEPDHVATA